MKEVTTNNQVIQDC